MKPLTLLFLLSTTILLHSHSQTIPLDPANTWITPGQTYIRIVTVDQGIYHVTANDLSAAGFNPATVNPDHLHLLHRGTEQPIYVAKNGSQLDFLEFYAEENNGRDEVYLYRDNNGQVDSTAHPNPEMSQISNEAVSFLTWDAQPGLRWTDYAAYDYSNYLHETSFRRRVALNYADTLVQQSPSNGAVGYEANPNYVSGEGYAGPFFRDSLNAHFTVLTPRHAQIADTSQLRIRGFGNTIGNHEVHAQIGFDNILVCTSSSFESFDASAPFSIYLAHSTNLILTEIKPAADFLTRIEITYSKEFFLDGAATEHLVEYNKPNDTYLNWQNADANNDCWIFDLTTRQRILGTVSQEFNGRNLHIIVPGNAATREMFLVTDNGLRSPIRIEAAHMQNHSNTSGVDFVILSDRSLQASAEAYATYRNSSPTNAMSADVFYTDEIADEFGYGTTTPLAIKRFIMTAHQTWSNPPKFVLLWGKAKNDSRNAIGNLVPSWGYPAYDLEYTSNFNHSPADYYPQIPIGRIPVTNDAQGLDYLAKVRLYEAYSFEPWMLNAVFLSYDNPDLATIMHSQLSDDSIRYANGVPGGTALLYHSDSSGVHTTAPITARQAINNGVAWIDIKESSMDNASGYNSDLQEPSTYANSGKFPFIYAFGRNPTSCLDDSLLFAERWLMEPHKGAIGFLGPSNYSFSAPLSTFSTNFWNLAFNNTAGLPIGELMDSTMAIANAAYHGATPRFCDFLLIGDPSIVIINPFTTAIQEHTPDEFQFSAFPNPFNTTIHFSFQLPKPAEVTLDVFDLTGRKVHSIPTQIRSAALQSIEWQTPSTLPAGIYLAKLQAGTQKAIIKLVRIQ